MHTINTYTLQQQNDEIIDYVSDEIDGKRVVMQALKFEFEDKTIYTLDGLIMKDCYHITFIDSNGIEKTGITEHGGEINEKIDGDESKAELSWKQTPANIIRITKFNK